MEKKCANHCIECSVHQCAHHCGSENYCALKSLPPEQTPRRAESGRKSMRELLKEFPRVFLGAFDDPS